MFFTMDGIVGVVLGIMRLVLDAVIHNTIATEAFISKMA